MATAAVYLRGSASGVTAHYGLAAQERACRAWAKRNGWQIASVHCDAGASGALHAAERSGLIAALRKVRTGGADGLLVARMDRLSRRVTTQEATLLLVWRCGGRVLTADAGELETDDPNDEMRRGIRQMLSVFTELDRATATAGLRVAPVETYPTGPRAAPNTFLPRPWTPPGCTG